MVWLMILAAFTAPPLLAAPYFSNTSVDSKELNACAGEAPKDPPAIANLTRRRQFLVEEAKLAARYSDDALYDINLDKIRTINAQIIRQVGAQAIVDIEVFNNPCRAQLFLSHHSGGQIFIRPRGDGRFALIVLGRDGRAVPVPGSENLSQTALVNRIRRVTDELLSASGM